MTQRGRRTPRGRSPRPRRRSASRGGETEPDRAGFEDEIRPDQNGGGRGQPGRRASMPTRPARNSTRTSTRPPREIRHGATIMKSTTGSWPPARRRRVPRATRPAFGRCPKVASTRSPPEIGTTQNMPSCPAAVSPRRKAAAGPANTRHERPAVLAVARPVAQRRELRAARGQGNSDPRLRNLERGRYPAVGLVTRSRRSPIRSRQSSRTRSPAANNGRGQRDDHRRRTSMRVASPRP